MSGELCFDWKIVALYRNIDARISLLFAQGKFKRPLQIRVNLVEINHN
jgi:hypothetical protein